MNSSVISGACGLVAALVVSVGGVNAVQSATAGDPVAEVVARRVLGRVTGPVRSAPRAPAHRDVLAPARRPRLQRGGSGSRAPSTSSAPGSATTRPHWGSVEVIVVDNASTDGTADVARDAVDPGPPGHGGALRPTRQGRGGARRHARHDRRPRRLRRRRRRHQLRGPRHGVALIDRRCGRGDRLACGRRLGDDDAPQRRPRARARRSTAGRPRAWSPGIRDTQCGFKLFRGTLARTIWADTRIDGFSFDVEVLGRAQAARRRRSRSSRSPGSTCPARRSARLATAWSPSASSPGSV